MMSVPNLEHSLWCESAVFNFLLRFQVAVPESLLYLMFLMLSLNAEQ